VCVCVCVCVRARVVFRCVRHLPAAVGSGSVPTGALAPCAHKQPPDSMPARCLWHRQLRPKRMPPLAKRGMPPLAARILTLMTLPLKPKAEVPRVLELGTRHGRVSNLQAPSTGGAAAAAWTRLWRPPPACPALQYKK
jgi:hypothetical protein